MRFTVHDSPDYYQLKVSVFNDDKKTELIGETWVPLDQIVVAGGGQNDLWHHLNCKGRFAGEIRIELTYYDSRPKEEKAETRLQEIPVHNLHEQPKEGIGGPRQPKPIKRRPLPADPTQAATPQSAILEHSQPALMTYTPPLSNHHTPNPQVQHVSQPMDQFRDSSPLSKPGYQPLHNGDSVSPIPYNRYGQELYQEDLRRTSVGGSELPLHHIDINSTGDLDASRMNYPLKKAMTWHQGPHGQVHDQILPSEGESYRPDESRAQTSQLQRYAADDMQSAGPSPRHYETYSQESIRESPSMPQQYSVMEAYPDTSIQSVSPQTHMSPMSNNQRYDIPTRFHSTSAIRDPWPIASHDEDGPPPPPPVHRNSGNISSQQPSERNYPTGTPSPLNIRNHRASASGSPLTLFQGVPSHIGFVPSPSSANSPSIPQPGTSASSHFSHSQPSRQRSQINLAQPPVAEFVHAIPPSLVPGYEPGVAEEFSERLLDDRRSTPRRSIAAESYASPQSFTARQSVPDSSIQYQSLPNRAPQPESPANYYELSQQHQQPVLPRSSQSQSYPSPQNNHIKAVRRHDMARERIYHSSSAPIIESGPVKPDPRTPLRKSVSPAPERPPGERCASAVPFSPDSYESFNPSLSAASSINLSGPQYQTPEQARDALHEREKEARLSEGPIIDSNGKVIDPSDHLPTDTWAPEPEPKPPRKGPEITLRFRHTPQGAQPMPLSARRSPHDRSPRPHSSSTSIYAQSPLSTSPANFASRAQLQNRPYGSPSQPSSSPVVPTVHTYVARSSMPRASVSDYSLPSIETHGYSQGASPYSRGSPGYGVPPPVPGKIPIASGERVMGMSALSEEMSRIDIGVGGGQTRSRRSKYGA